MLTVTCSCCLLIRLHYFLPSLLCDSTMLLLCHRLAEKVANITLVNSANIDVWSLWSTVAATSQRLDEDALLL